MSGCRGTKPCACRDCGPFLINGKGQFRSLGGEPLPAGAARRSMGARLTELWKGSLRGGDPLHAHEGSESHFRARSSPPLQVGMPGASGAATAVPVSMRARDRAWSQVPGSETWRPGQRNRVRGPSPIGTLPSISPGSGVSFEDFSTTPPRGPQPYGMLPLGPGPVDMQGGSLALGWEENEAPWESLPLMDVQPVRQYVPPPPAPQGVAIVNGFDRSWGEPPTSYKGVKMRFDPRLGGYAFDHSSDHVRQAFDATGQPALSEWYADIAHRYQMGLMLQPWRDDTAGASPQWQFRWVPRRREVSYE